MADIEAEVTRQAAGGGRKRGKPSTEAQRRKRRRQKLRKRQKCAAIKRGSENVVSSNQDPPFRRAKVRTQFPSQLHPLSAIKARPGYIDKTV